MRPESEGEGPGGQRTGLQLSGRMRSACEGARNRLGSGVAESVSPEYLATLRRMSGAAKLRTAFALYWEARKLKAARLRRLHPDWSEEEIQARVREIFMHAVT